MTHVDSVESAGGRLGAVLSAPRSGVAQLGPRGPWLVTNPALARQVLTDVSAFDFPGDISRSGDLSRSIGDTRSGHVTFDPLGPDHVARGVVTFRDEWEDALTRHGRGAVGGPYDAMELLRRPISLSTIAAVLPDLDEHRRRGSPTWCSPGSTPSHPSSRRAVRPDGSAGHAAWNVAPASPWRTPSTRSSASWLLPLTWRRCWPQVSRCRSLRERGCWRGWPTIPPASSTRWTPSGRPCASHLPRGSRLASPPGTSTWVARAVPSGAVVLVSPLLLGRLPELVPGEPEKLPAFDPGRWRDTHAAARRLASLRRRPALLPGPLARHGAARRARDLGQPGTSSP